MLKAAALLQLDLVRSAIERGMMLKDASPYNIQFDGPHPVFIDLGSFERYRSGSPWQAYAQFCALFLNPLMLTSYQGVAFQPLLRSYLEGISPESLTKMLSLRAKLRRGVFVNVVLQAFLQRQFRLASPRDVGAQPSVSKESITRRVMGLRDVVSHLRSPATRSAWTDYEDANSYTPEARAQKAAFVERTLVDDRPRLVFDLGSNRGEYALVASRHAEMVVAMDADPDVVELLYARVRDADSRILPLVMDLRNPSPDQGWDERERAGLTSRGRADVVLALALVHHLRMSGNIPLRLFVRWLARLGRRCIVEFVPKTDPQARRLLAWRDDVYDDYEAAAFEATLRERFVIEERYELPGSTRVLYSARAR